MLSHPTKMLWWKRNIPGGDVSRGEVLSGYIGSGPPDGTGIHRYVYILYKQTKKLEFDEKRLTNKKLKGSLKIALATLALLEEIISKAENANAYELCHLVRATGSLLCRALKHCPVAANIARRVIRAVRLETRVNTDQSSEVAGDSLQKLVLCAPTRRGTVVGPDQQDIREPIREHIAELRLELESTVSSISAQALEHIDSDSVVLCGQASPLVESFLRAAFRERAFRLVLPEGPGKNQTHAMAARLSSDGLPTTIISNAAIFAIMSRITKVVIGLSCALGGGAALAAPGTLNITSAAQHYNVPVLALSPLYKLTPLHAADPQDVPLACPAAMHNYQDLKSDSSHVYVPLHDFITPDHITLFITNTGGNSPSYIYRTMSELYDPADDEL